MPEPRVAHVLFCDQIRTEPSGRPSYVGLRSGEVVTNVERRGSAFRFSVVCWLICDADDVPSRLAMRVYGPPGRLLLINSEVKPAAPPRRSDSTKAFFQLTVEDIRLPLSQEGDIEVVVDTETGILRAGRLRVRFVAEQPLQPAGG
jgi:hypothetical protein